MYTPNSKALLIGEQNEIIIYKSLAVRAEVYEFYSFLYFILRYLKTLKSAKKIALYTSKIKMVRKTIIKRSILYALGSIATSAIQTGLKYTVNNFLGWN